MTATHQGQILVVEDEEAAGRILRLLLESVGFTIQTVRSGADALAFASDHPVDLVVLDLKLPDMHGYDVAKELRKVYHPWTVPILMLTGMDRPIDQLRGFAYGADAYVTKPYEFAELLRTIELLLGQTTPA
jgi:DNA-binding response OmpR family regulator